MTLDQKRINLIAVLHEGGKSVGETNVILVAKGLDPLSETEAAVFKPITVADIMATKQADGIKDADLAPAAPQTDKGTPPTADAPATKVAGFELAHPKFGALVGHLDGKPVTVAQAMCNTFCHNMVDMLKHVLGPKWYAEYRALKYPGGNESMATEETKMKAYIFAFETILKLKLSVHA